MKKFLPNFLESLRIENASQVLISRQSRKGVLFDTKQAKHHLTTLGTRLENRYNSVLPFLDKDVIRPYNGPVNKPFLKSGGYVSNVIKWYGDDIPDIGGPFSRVDFEDLVLSKRGKLIKQLLKRGWKPMYFTKETEAGGGNNPKITHEKEPCPNLMRIKGFPGRKLSEWFTYAHRRSQINGFIEQVRPDGRLSAGAVVCGTNTRRMKHRVVVNVPRVTSIFGKEMRELFYAEEGYKIVGCDADGLELRMLCHYMNDPEYTDIVLHGDIHWHNVLLLGWFPPGTLRDHDNPKHEEARDNAKTFIYAFLYGAGDKKLGHIVKGTSKDGKKLRARFMEGLPQLETLMTKIKKSAKKGFIRGIDGGRVWMRRDSGGKVMEHKALNTLLQSAGSIVMKQAAIFANELTWDDNADMILNVHDEYQFSVIEEEVERVSRRLEESITLAGRYMNLRIALAGTAQAGNNWSQTH